jgi:hypothetical protein
VPSVTLASTDIVSLEEFNDFLGKDSNDDADKRKIRLLNQLSVETENFLRRLLVTRGAQTEYHTVPTDTREIRLSEYPLIGAASTVTVYEDTNWESKAAANWYSSDTQLTLNVDYRVMKDPEPLSFCRLYRIGTCWATGEKAIKVVVSSTGCGYATTALVPQPVKAVVLDAGRRIWTLANQGDPTALSWTDQMGTTTRPLPGLLLQNEKDRLEAQGYRRPYDFAPTWERDAA